MRKIILAVAALVAVCVFVGCASRGEKYASSLKSDTEKVQKCQSLARICTSPGAYLGKSPGDMENAIDLCQAVVRQVPNDIRPLLSLIELQTYKGDKKGACKTYAALRERGYFGSAGAFCNDDGSLKE
ncbi:hypothetical protein DWB63_07400 [Pseudodesulfovibrio sp. S3]|nr:hypothetical protein DWB63_07400 [Pseudodesulfovibrio sp. S3]